MNDSWNNRGQGENPQDERLKEIISNAVSNSLRAQIATQKRHLDGTVETINDTLQEVKGARQTLQHIYRAHNEDLQRAADLTQELTAAADRQQQTIAQLDGKIATLSSTIEEAQAAQQKAAQEKAEAQAEREKAQAAQEEADKAVARAKKLTALQEKQDQLDRDYEAELDRLAAERAERIQAIDKQLTDLQ